MKVLLVEDDRKIAAFVKRGLEEEGIVVDAAFDGNDGLYLSQSHDYDVIVLDWMLPGVSGIDICRQLRARKIPTPVLMLSARGDTDDKIEGFESGVDDYLGKPFSFREFTARIHALHRRHKYNAYGLLKVKDLILDPASRTVKRSGKTIDLSTKEFMLLELLLKNRNRVVSTTMIRERLWGMDESVQSNVINVTIHHLRQKIDAEYNNKLIKTVRGSGYRLETDDS